MMVITQNRTLRCWIASLPSGAVDFGPALPPRGRAVPLLAANKARPHFLARNASLSEGRNS